MQVAWKSAYFESFLLAVASAAPPADWDERWPYESVRVYIIIIIIITAARPAYAGTEGCYEMLVFFLFFLFNA